jgi:hypothetical protein
MIDLKQLFGDTFRVVLDESAELDGQTREERLWLLRLKGKRGHVYVHSKTRLGAYLERPATATYGQQLLAVPSAQLHQSGDREMTATFDPVDIDAVAKVLGLYRRKQYSPEALQASTERLARHREFAKHSEPVQL